MKKHLLEIPSVIALMFDLDWDDANVEQLKLDCVSQLQSLRFFFKFIRKSFNK